MFWAAYFARVAYSSFTLRGKISLLVSRRVVYRYVRFEFGGRCWFCRIWLPCQALDSNAAREWTVAYTNLNINAKIKTRETAHVFEGTHRHLIKPCESQMPTHLPTNFLLTYHRRGNFSLKTRVESFFKRQKRARWFVNKLWILTYDAWKPTERTQIFFLIVNLPVRLPHGQIRQIIAHLKRLGEYIWQKNIETS